MLNRPPQNSCVRVVIDLPSHPSTGGESLWAQPLGNNEYELQNSPFYAYGLNFLDVVRATVMEPGQIPTVQAIIRRGGHATLRVFFLEAVAVADRLALLDSLTDLGVTYEGANQRYLSLDVPPETPIAEVRVRLDDWEEKEWIEYETCEERIPGSFDDVLEGPESESST